MKKKIVNTLLALCMPVLSFCQTPAAVPKDAKIDVSVQNEKTGQMLNNEIVVFKSRANGLEYQGLTDSTGKFSLRLPFGDKYDYFVLGFHDSLENNVLDIPALRPGVFYKGTFTNIDIQFTPPASFVLQGCNFETGKATLNQESYTVLDELEIGRASCRERV